MVAKTSTPKLSLINQFSNFTRTTAGLEKTLRLIQSLAQIVLELDTDPTSTTQWGTAKSQLALTRRFFRFFAFIDCFDRVYDLLGGRGGGGGQGPFMTLVEIGRWSCLGLYFVLEDLTILHAMNVYHVSWNMPVLVEAYKFWFYALSLSIFGAVWGLLFTSSPSPGKTGGNGNKKGGKNAVKVARGDERHRAERRVLVKRIVVDGCDLLIPGVFVGWMNASELMVGVTMVVSTVVSGGDVWGRAQV
ncbi:peroxisomal biogenesis factor 11 [Aspergillus alliaceus]|uniref:Peroxisomal biogenesis factor 11 n=1 Tax=Petromyces alliaceus TaxID=209559 RepID=A0A5N7BWQ5_PETAA|nr:peroxisomal biogenesis factor 11 [Aspergillus alliaceus]